MGVYSHRMYDPIYMPFKENNEIPYVLKPNLVNKRSRGNIRINTDELGLRNIIAGKKHGPKGKDFRIGIVGDSYTFGNGVQTDETFPFRIEEFLNRTQSQTKVDVFNFAQEAYSVKEMAATLKFRMLDIHPDLVIMSPIYDDFDLTRTPVADNWGYTVHKRKGVIVPSTSYLKVLLRKLQLSYLIYNVVNAWRERRNPSTTIYQLKGSIPDSYKYILEFKRTADQNKIPYLIILIPQKPEDPLFAGVKKRLRKDGVNFLDCTNILLDHGLLPEEFNLPDKYNGHLSAKTHKILGEFIGEYISENFFTVSVKDSPKLSSSD